MRTALFGGSFDPIHIGHLHVADEVITRLGFDRVLFVIARVNPHKMSGPNASDADRVEMVRRATADNPAFDIVVDEIERSGPSYTIDTVQSLVADGRIEPEPGLIVGDDILDELHRWRDVETLERSVHLIVAGRDRSQRDRLSIGWRSWESVDNTLLSVSSSDIRSRIGTGIAFRYLVHEEVYRYIVRHELYSRVD